MTERRQFPKYDCDIFETNGLDDASAVMHMFDRKNKRVNQIFNDTAEEIAIEDKSYGLHLISRRESTSNKENASRQSPHLGKERSVRALSPVEIIIASNEEISDPATNENFKEPAAIAKPPRNNISLRRSLFQQANATNQHKEKDMICSTPVTQRICRQDSFFNATETAESLSPIRANGTVACSSQALNGIEQIVPSQDEEAAAPVLVQEVNSLAALENDLKKQYQLEIERTPSRRSRCRSRISDQSASSQPVVSENARQKDRTPAGAITQELSIQVQPMDISEDVISNYRQNQISRLSYSNQTDVNSIRIVETPLTKRTQIAQCDSALARKLLQCESDSNVTDDDGGTVEDICTPRTPVGKMSIMSQSKHHSKKYTSTAISSDFTDHENVENEKKSTAIEKEKSPAARRVTRARGISLMQQSNESSGKGNVDETTDEESEDGTVTNDDKSRETVVFKKPPLAVPVAQKAKKQYSVLTTNNTSIEAAHVSQSVVESLTNLRKTINESVGATAVRENRSKRFSIPKRTRAKTKLLLSQENIPDYLKPSKMRKTVDKGQKSNNKRSTKRTLFTQSSMIENELDEQHPSVDSDQQGDSMESTKEQLVDKSLAASDYDLRVTVTQIRHSLDNASNASTEFDAEIPEKPSATKGGKRRKRNRSALSGAKIEPPERRARMEEANAEKSDDEGLGSDDAVDNIKYDPYKNGCTRRGLRVRRFPRVWWRHDHEAEKYGLVYGCYDKNIYYAEEKNKRLKTTRGASRNKVLYEGICTDPVNMLKQIKPKSNPRSKRVVKGSEKQNLPAIQAHSNSGGGNGDDASSSCASEALSTCTFKTAHSRSETIKKVFESYTSDRSDAPQSHSKMTKSYDFQQINKLDWTVCGTNMMYHQFVNNKNDGFIQFLPGAVKPRAKTRRAVLKFVLLSGKIDFCVNDCKETLEHLGYISIEPGNTYSAKNPYDQPAILTFTKLDVPDSNVSSSVLENSN